MYYIISENIYYMKWIFLINFLKNLKYWTKAARLKPSRGNCKSSGSMPDVRGLTALAFQLYCTHCFSLLGWLHSLHVALCSRCAAIALTPQHLGVSSTIPVSLSQPYAVASQDCLPSLVGP